MSCPKCGCSCTDEEDWDSEYVDDGLRWHGPLTESEAIVHEIATQAAIKAFKRGQSAFNLLLSKEPIPYSGGTSIEFFKSFV